MSNLSSPRGGLTPLWTYAACYGALWGGLEITLGSLLHGLRLPFVGLALACAQGAFLVAIHALVQRRGLVIATSLVVALVKGLSPSGAILGPMIAIAVQGALVELSLLLPGRRLPAALGVGLCPLWAIAQALLTQMLYFGTAVLSLYGHLVRAMGRATGLSGELAFVPLGLILGVIFAMGAMSGLWGLGLGIRARGLLGGAEGAEPQHPEEHPHAAPVGSGALVEGKETP